MQKSWRGLPAIARPSILSASPVPYTSAVITVRIVASGVISATKRSSSSGCPKCMNRPPLQVPIASGPGSMPPEFRRRRPAGRTRCARRARPGRSALAPPPPTLEVVEDDLVTAAGGHDLPVVAPERALGPPAILDKPRLSDGVDLAAIDRERPSLLARRNGYPTGD